MRKLFELFKDEDGAVTVDWIALTAGLIAFCLATIVLFQEIAVDRADWIASESAKVGAAMMPK